MKKFLAMLLALTMMLSLTACGSETQAEDETAPPATENTETKENTGDSKVEVDKNLFSVELTIPADFIEEDITQESLDAKVAEEGFKSATLNSDGSVTYVMTKDQHKAMMEETKANIDENLAEMVSSDDYPSIVGIEANADYTAFDVTLSTDTVGLTESIAVMGFYMFGGLYNVFNGTEADNISVSFINQATGEVIQTANSKDIQ